MKQYSIYQPYTHTQHIHNYKYSHIYIHILIKYSFNFKRVLQKQLNLDSIFKPCNFFI